MGHRLGFDIGGTFTDLFAIDDDSGETYREKVATTPEDLKDGVLDGVERLYNSTDLSESDATFVSHGTTAATNALIEGKGVETGLITTEGFRDVIAIGREDRRDIFEYSPAKTDHFVRRQYRVMVQERISAGGEVIEPLSPRSAERAVDELLESGVGSIAVSLVNAYLNDEHERRVADVVQSKCSLPVSLSSEVMPEIGEYERTLSTVINATIEPVVSEYTERLVSDLRDRGLEADLFLMQADGGLITPSALSQGRSLRIINSGPAGGVLGAKQFARLAGESDIITLDMGGTSTDTSIVHDDEIEITTNGEISETGIPLLFPQIDIKTVGAGGGSIAWIDSSSRLRVGPKSAGARPGPACYGRGGTEPTVTDAAVVLGYLNPDYFLGGEMELDDVAAERALAAVADDLGQEVTKIAEGIIDIAVAKMKRAIRETSIEQGYDPRDFVLTCYGGAGPLFAARLAAELEIGRALVPPSPGVLSAAGLVSADKQFNFSTSRPLGFDSDRTATIAEIFAELGDDASGVRTPDSTIIRAVDLAYEDQGTYKTIRMPEGPIDGKRIEQTRRRFDDEYEATYGYAYPDRPVETVTWRLQVRRGTPDLSPNTCAEGGSMGDARKGTRDVFFEGSTVEHVVFDRTRLPASETFSGPAIVEESESTVHVPPDTTASVDGVGNLVVDF